MVFEYKSPWSGELERIRLFKKYYIYSNNLRVMAETEQGEPFTSITVCIPHVNSNLKDESLAFVDINNNPGIDKWLEENNIAKPTGYYGDSGFCSYPEYKFNLSILEEN